MHDLAVPLKTDAARLMLAQRDALSRAQRSFLIMVDGRRSLAQLKAAMSTLGVSLDHLRELTAQGLLHWQEPVAKARASAVAAARASALPVEAPVAAPVAPMAQVAPVPATVSLAAQATASAPMPLDEGEDDGRSLPAAKFYALNLVSLMLVGQDEGPRRALRVVASAQQLLDWMGLCHELVSQAAGPERAQLFINRIWAVLPDDARDLAIDQPWFDQVTA